MRNSSIFKAFWFVLCCFVIYLTITSELPIFLRWIPNWIILSITIVALAIQLYSDVINILPVKKSLPLDKVNETSFPFEIVDSLEKLHSLLFPPLSSTSIPDTEIPLIDRGIARLSNEFNRTGRVILLGQSKQGKTRLMTEILSNEMMEGTGILILKRYHWFYRNFVPPEALRNFKALIIAIDDLNHYLRFRLPSDSGLISFSFDQFLTETIHTIESTCGNDINIKIIITARPQQIFWQSYNLEQELWGSFELINTSPLSNQETKELIQKLSNRTGIQVNSRVEQELTLRNDGTFLPLILAFRKWKSLGIQSLGSNEVSSFEGQFRNAWAERFNELVNQNEFVRNIYSVIALLQNQGIAPSVLLVEELTTLLSMNTFTLFAAHWNTLFSYYCIYPLLNKTEKYWRKFNIVNIGLLYCMVLAISLFVLRLGGSKLLTILFGVSIFMIFVLMLLYSAIILIASISSNVEANIRSKIQRSVQQFIKLEIPITNDIFYPYDGQVDGISSHKSLSRLSNVIQHGSSVHWESSFLSLCLLDAAKKLQWRYSEETLRILQLCKGINPKLFDAPFLESQIYQVEHLQQMAKEGYKRLITAAPATMIPDIYAELGLVELQLRNFRTSKQLAKLTLRLTNNGILTARSQFLAYLCARKDISTLEKALLKWVRSAPDPKEISALIGLFASLDSNVRTIYDIERVEASLKNALRARPGGMGYFFTTLSESYAQRISDLLSYPISSLFFPLLVIILSYPLLLSYTPGVVNHLLSVTIFVERDIPWLYAQRAYANALLERPEDCISDTMQANQLDPEDPYIYYVRGICYFEHNTQKVIENFSVALTLDSKTRSNPSSYVQNLSYSADYTYYLRGIAHQTSGDFSQAIADYSSAIELSSFHPEYYLLRGGANFETNQYPLAIKDFSFVIGMPVPIGAESRKGDAYYARALTYYRQGDIEDALRDLDAAIKPNYADGEISDYSLIRAYFLRGLIELDKGQATLATQDCSQAKALAVARQDSSIETSIDQCISEANVILNAPP